MRNFTEVAEVVRALAEFFSAHDLAAAEKTLVDSTVCGQLSLAEFKDELLAQSAVGQMVKRFRMNPFDMENVFDLEGVLRKAAAEHPLFTSEEGEFESKIHPGPPKHPFTKQSIQKEGEPLAKSGGSGNASPFAKGERGGFVDEAINPTRGDNNLQTLLRYLQWANQVFYQSCAELPEHELSALRPMLFDTILNLLNHVYAMQLVWQAHLLGQSHGIASRRPAETDVLDFVTLRQQQAELDAWYVAYADELSVERQAEVVAFEFIDGESGAMMRAEMLQHVVHHASYHRGHIEGVFYQLGMEPPTTDIPVFLRLCGSV